MRAFTSRICVATLLCVGTFVPTAGAIERGITITPGINYYWWDRERTLEDNLGVRLGFGYQINENWSTELVVADVDTHFESLKDVDADLTHLQIDLMYTFFPDSRMRPYLVVGAGGGIFERDDRSESEPLIDWGLGLRTQVSERIAILGDVRAYTSTETKDDDVVAMLAASFNFGQKTPLDSDGDGVTDDMDQCPDTPAGVAVDKAGCPLDSDGDGVADYLDKCPDTPEGVEVNADGCPLDSDGDGVADYLDKCPKTPKGAKVDENGCQIILKEPVSIKLEVLFPTNSAAIAPTYYPEIKEVADFMVEYPSTEVTIEGHTDSTGAAEYNRVLSQRRANAVRQVLLERYSVDAKRVRAVGYGEERPVADNGTAAGRQANRRVVAVLKATKEKVLQKD
ncbi:MAG: OmpA family protein [Pseudomonadota bacterium]|nr:OmpA family protein [Pseudomonadota bacterium]